MSANPFSHKEYEMREVVDLVMAEPVVRLVGRQRVDEAALASFLAAHDVEGWETDTDVAAQKLAEVAGRLCYMSFARPRPGGNQAYLGHLLGVGHGSVLEHAVFNFIITGVSRSFSHELVRHRAGFGYSQLSQRFVDESRAEFAVHPGLAECRRQFERFDDGDADLTDEQYADAQAFAVFRDALEHAQDAYRKLSDHFTRKYAHAVADRTLARKRAREVARTVLPNATETKVFVTANARALRHFVELRGSVHADAEIRAVATQFLDVLQREAPNLFGDYAATPDGSIATDHPKV